ncbi:MAG: DUF3224 domain-containing protein [Chloroflexota bacterium]
MIRLTGTFEVTGGDEAEVEQREGVRITRVDGTQRFSGDIEGEGHVTWLMAYLPDGSARFVGFQRIDGTFGGRAGSLIIESTGDHDRTASQGHWGVLKRAGTGAVGRATGSGSFHAPGGPTVTYELELDGID